jgi:CRISPR type I-E-associated protein CasB/Cse2
MSDAHLRHIAMAASLLCHRQDVRSGPQSFAAALGPRADGERAVLAPLRFQSLMAAIGRADDTEQMTALRRALALAKDTSFNITGFVRDLLAFSDQTRIRWTFDYYGAARETGPVEPIFEAEETLS